MSKKTSLILEQAQQFAALASRVQTDDLTQTAPLLSHSIQSDVDASAMQTLSASRPSIKVSLTGTDGDDILTGGARNDTLRGGDGSDILRGLGGHDVLYGDAGNDWLQGGAGNDRLYGGDDNDILMGGNGNDMLYGDAGNDILMGENGNDILHGGDGNDYITGGNGNDRLYGGDGNDTLVGGAGNDLLYGGNGDDILMMGPGRDVATGGAGRDTFMIMNIDSRVDQITDFTTGRGGGDVLNLAAVLQGFDPLTDSINDFVQLTQVAGGTMVSINATGADGGAFVNSVLLAGGIPLSSAADMLSSGNLLVEFGTTTHVES